MKSKRDPAFRRLFSKLPPDVQAQAIKQYKLFRKDPGHPSLYFKHVGNSIYSARIDATYRALGIKEGDTISWFWIGLHTEYDQLLGHRKKRLP